MFDEISMKTLFGWAFALSAVLFVGSLIVMPILLSRMRPDYFVRRRSTKESGSDRHSMPRLFWIVVKNIVGFVLLLMGIAMLVLPGQGLLTILTATTLLNFPGKRKLELRIVRQRHVRRAIDWVRKRAKQPPLILPEQE
jgi:hypothetical protein